MAIVPTYVSPGVEIREIDESVRASIPAGTTVFVPVFAQQGPSNEVNYVSSLDDYVQMFGLPTNAAERYGYFTISKLFESQATIAVTRLPYGDGEGDIKSPQYTLLAYPALNYGINQTASYITASADNRLDTTKILYSKSGSTYTEVDAPTLLKIRIQYYTDQAGTKLVDFTTKVQIFTKAGDVYTEVTDTATQNAVFTTYYINQKVASFDSLTNYSGGSVGVDGKYEGSATMVVGEPVQFNISLEQYYRFLNNQSLDGKGDFVWSDLIPSSVSTDLKDLGQFAFITLNVGKTVTNDAYEGFYIGLTDNAFTSPDGRYAGIRNLKTILKLADQDVGLTGTDYTVVPKQRLDFKLDSELKGCISQIMQEAITSFNTSGAQWDDTFNVGIFKIRQSTTSGDALKLGAIINEGYNASVEYGRKTTSKYTTTAVDFFIENTTSTDTLLNFFVNPYVSGMLNPRGLYADGTPKLKIRVYAQQLSDIAITDAELSTLDIDAIMKMPAGISLKALQNIVTANPTFNLADAMYPIGLYSKSNNATKIIGNLPAKVASAMSLIKNDELYNIDIITEGGLGTIYVGAMDAASQQYNILLAEAVAKDVARGDGKTTEADAVKALYPEEIVPSAAIFDDTKVIEGVTDMRTGKSTLSPAAEKVIANFKAVQNQFLALATSQQNGGRGDVFFIGDTIRQIAVEGKDNKIERQYGMPLINASYSALDNVKHSFSTSIYWPLRHLYEATATSFMAVYPYFLKAQDVSNNVQYWYPSSGAIAAKMAAADSLYGPWQAAAGAKNGVLTNIIDISFNTNQRQRDDLYKISLNPCIVSPEVGTCAWGIRTMIKVASAFDQIPSRRTFLYIAKILRDTSKPFLFEGNNDFTRLQLTNTVTPIMDRIQQAKGIYSYRFICSKLNNPDSVVDQGILVQDLYASPSRSVEQILINMHATRSGSIVTEYDSTL